jgi:hypothetical protein
MRVEGPSYATRENVKSALDIKETARNDVAVDRALSGASRSVDTLCRRTFYPVLATRSLAWPDRNQPQPWKLWLDEHELVSVASLVSGGTVIDPTDYFLEPQASGPPYNRIEINRSATATFHTGLTPQRNISILGLFGYDLVTEAAGALAEALDATETGVNVTDSSTVGVGDLVTVDAERMIVTGKASLATGQSVTNALTASTADAALTVGAGSAFTIGEVITVDTERMLILDILGNVLAVRRAWDGSVLATHSGAAPIFASRTLSVERGSLGTTAATHADAAPVARQVWPELVHSLTVAQAVADLLQEQAGWARVSGEAEGARETRAVGLADLARRCRSEHGRASRNWAV